jgi:XTP/dITP diphosphohydrolase
MTSPLEQAVEVMDRLRSPGGCPWDAAQTHESLTRYLLEEAYEVIEAIETGDRAHLREELGDLLLQVLFHARITQELPPGEAFGIEDVAADLVAKLVRRHPHVFAGADAGSAEQLNETWEQQKIAEKGRTSAVDGVPLQQPALALAAKLVARARRSGIEVEVPADDELGARLFALVEEAAAAGTDPEAALRRTARAYRAAVLAAEAVPPVESQAKEKSQPVARGELPPGTVPA